MTGGDSQIDGPSDSCYLTWTCCFLRGDTNGDHYITVLDLTNVSGIVNQNETTATYVANFDSCDVNDDGLLTELDITYLSQYLYYSGPQPPQPFPYRGADPTADTILAPCTDQYDKESEMNPLDRAEIALPPAETPGFPQDLLPEQPVEPIDGTGGLGALGPDLPVFPGPGGLAWGCRPSYKTRHTVRGLEAAWGDMDTEQGVNWFSGVPHLSQARDGTYWVRWSANCVRQYQATAAPDVFAGKYTNMTSLLYDLVNNEFLLHDLAGRVYVFYGYGNGTAGQSATIPRSVKGRIKRIEGIGGTLNGGTVVKPRVSFAWDPWSGCLDKVEVISSDDEANPCQTWDYAFTEPPALRIDQVEFRRPNGEAPLRIVFRYYSAGVTEEGGTEGDLMQIDVRTSLSPTSELSAPDMIARTYYYRYYVTTWADADGARGYPHQVRFFYGPDACKEFLAASYKTDALSALEDREYEYCVDRRPKTLSVKGGCAGCCGGGTGDYAYTWYLGKAIAAASVNESHVKVSIALANDDVHSSRRVLVFNAFGQKLIDATCVKESSESAELSWVWAGVYTTLTGGQWCLQDKFWPSACGSFDPNAGEALDCAACGTNPVFSGNGGLSAYVPGTGKHQCAPYQNDCRLEASIT